LDRNLANDVAAASIVTVAGVFFRHAYLGTRGLRGSDSGGRWGPPRAFPVLYLGRPPESIVVEAYRHLVDPVEGMRGDLVAPRRFYTCQVGVTRILDLRVPESLLRVRLTNNDLSGSHERCQSVGLAAHQLGLHGILAPAATQLGETLALFERHLPAEELPVVTQEVVWEKLPADPRRFRIVPGLGPSPA
jgi:RES domain-containing protein